MTNYTEQINKRRARALSEKFKLKSYSETWGVLRYVALVSTYIVQVLTAVCALALPAYFFKVLFGSWVAGFAVGAIFLIAFETVKRVMSNNAALSFYKKGSVSVLGVLGVLGVIAASVAWSYFGTPILVREFSPMPAEPNYQAMIAHFDSLKAEAKAYWSDVKTGYLLKAEEVHSKNNWKGVTTRDARATQLEMERKAGAAQDSLNKSLALLDAKQVETIQAAKSTFEDTTIIAKQERDNVGSVFAIITLVLELLFVVCVVWLNHYDFHEACELGVIAETHLKAVESFTESPVKPVKVEEMKAEQRPANNIGFYNEGKVVNTGKSTVILCKKSNGELKGYTKSQLSSLIGDARRKGNEDRAQYWETMQNKLIKHL